MSEVRVDRAGNLVTTPAYLAAIAPHERQWWRPVVAVVALIGALVFGQIGATVGVAVAEVAGSGGGASFAAEFERAASFDPLPGLADDARVIAVLGLSFGLAAVAFLLLLARIYRRPPIRWVTAAPRVSLRLLAAGLVSFSVILVVLGCIGFLIEPEDFTPPLLDEAQSLGSRLAYLIALLLFIPPQAAFEEIVTRGFVIQATAAFTRNLPVILIVNGVLFAGLHGTADVGANLAIAGSAVVWTWAALRLGGLEFAIGAHIANNVLVSAFGMPINDPPPDLRLIDVAFEAAACVLLLGVVEIIARSPRLRALAGAHQPS